MTEAKGFNIKYLIIGILFTFQCVGIYEHIFNVDEQKCDMTYMYQNPEYIPVPLPSNVTELYPRYRLYSYGEGALARAHAGQEYLGQPVLFLPGNLGSYKQVRSLASVAYRKSLKDDETRRFDFFTADLAEDLGAMYGPSLQEQTGFVSEIVPVIQELYITSRPVIIVAHSIGGLVAKAVLQHLLEGSVPLIITLATPHAAAVLALDEHVQKFYEEIEGYWALETEDGGKVASVTLVSVSGGRNDLLVSPLASVFPQSHVATSTPAVPGCWASTDHLSIVWCKQLVLALVRGLFDVVDRKTNALSTSKQKLSSVFDYHLISRHSGKEFESLKHKQTVKFSSKAAFVEVSQRQWERTVPARSQHTYFLIPLTGSPVSKYTKASVRVRGLEEKEWIFACAASAVGGAEGTSKSCATGQNLSKRFGRLLGNIGGTRAKFADVLLRPFVEEGYTHLVVDIPSSDHKVTVSVDVHGETERRVAVAAPRLVFSFSLTTIIKATPAKALTQEVQLEGVNEPWMSYDVSVLPSSSCSPNNSNSVPPQLWLQWHTSHRISLVHHRVVGQELMYRLEQDEIAVLPSTRSLTNEGNVPPERGDVTFTLLLEPRCLYTVSVKASLAGTFRRFFILYGAHVPAFIVCHLLLALSMQLKSVAASRYCPSVLTSLLALTPIAVVPFVKLSALVLARIDVYNDQQMLLDSRLDIGVLPIFLFLAWLPLTLIFAGGLWVAMLLAGNALHSLALKLFGASFGAGEIVADVALMGLSKIPAVVAVALLAVAFAACGALATALATLFYFILMFDMYKDYIKKVLLKLIPKLEEETPPEPQSSTTSSVESSSGGNTPPEASTSTTGSEEISSASTSTESVVVTRAVVPQSSESLGLQLHQTLLLLCMAMSVLQAPVLITWAVRVKHGASLNVDPSLGPSVVTLLSLALLWMCELKHERAHYKLVGQLLHFAAVVVLLFATLSSYRLPYFIASTLAVVALHQLLAPLKSEQQNQAMR